METNSLRTFVHVTDCGSFTAAAQRLGVDPSFVSRTIGALEKELGFQLFHRSTRKIALTSAGSVYLQRLTPLLEELQQAEEAARDQNLRPEGRLTLTASTAFGQIRILPHMAEFRQRYPGVRLNLRFTDSMLDIVAEQVDLACRLASTPDPNLVGRKLFSTCFLACASPEYLAKAGEPVGPAELEGHQTLAFNLPGYRERWLFKSSRGDITKVPLRPNIWVSNALALRELALAGMGIALLANWLVDDDLKNKRLVRLFSAYQVTGTDFESAAWLLYPSRRLIPGKTRAMVDFLREKLPPS